MSKYILNTMVVLLTLMLYRRSAVSFIKGKWAADKKAAAVLVCVGTALLCGAVIYFLTFFEACFVSVVASVGFLMRYTLLEIFKAQYARKHGKLHVVKAVCIICFSFWLGLALFYKTDIGVKTGLKNYLYHKYHEEFKYIGVKPDGVNYGFYPINGERDTDTFNVVRKRWLSVGSRLFASDNYYGIIIRDEYEKHVLTYADKYFDNCKAEVRFNSSGLSNLTYMSDEFDKSTTLEEFLAFQKDEDNIRGCNFADLFIDLNFQPTESDEITVTNKALNLFEDLTSEFCLLQVYITGSEDTYSVITGLITRDSKVGYYRISDNFFKAEE